MTTTVQELIKNLKDYPEATVVVIKHVDDVEFAIFEIVDFNLSENKVLTIGIREKIDDEEEEEE